MSTLRDIVYQNYKNQINMSLKELKAWRKNPISKKASISRKPINMAVRLNSKPVKKWGLTEIRWAVRKAIPYLKRAKQIKSTKIVAKGYTRNQIALKNWGYDVKKTLR